MISFSVEPGDGGARYYTKTGSEIQTDVRISGTSISGTLNYLDDYTTFLEDEAKHHLVLKLDKGNADKIETKMEGGAPHMSGYVSVDDGWCVYSVTDKDQQKIYVKATKNGKSVEKVYDLRKLTLAESE